MYTGETLKKLRLLKGFNQNGIAKKMGITQQAYSKLEKSSRIDEQKFKSLLKMLQCSDKDFEWIKSYPPLRKNNRLN